MVGRYDRKKGERPCQKIKPDCCLKSHSCHRHFYFQNIEPKANVVMHYPSTRERGKGGSRSRAEPIGNLRKSWAMGVSSSILYACFSFYFLVFILSLPRKQSPGNMHIPEAEVTSASVPDVEERASLLFVIIEKTQLFKVELFF